MSTCDTDSGRAPSLDSVAVRLEQARRHLIDLVRKSAAPPDSEEEIAQLNASSAHVWCLWAQPEPASTALLVSGEWSLAGFVLLGSFASVEWWETDLRRAELLRDVATQLEWPVRVSYCEPRSVAKRLGECRRRFGFAALQGVLGAIPRRERLLRKATLRTLAASVAGEGQCCVIDCSRFGVHRSGRPDRDRASTFSPPTHWEVQRGLRGQSVARQETVFFHPDHRQPAEILLPPSLLPRARRAALPMRALAKTGVVAFMLGAFACFSPRRSGSVLAEAAARAGDLLNRDAASLTCIERTVRNDTMLLVELADARGNGALLRIALGADAEGSLQRMDDAYLRLGQLPASLRELVPEALPLGRVRGWPVHVERRCRGVPAAELVHSAAGRDAVRRHVMCFVEHLLDATARRDVVDEDFFNARLRARFERVRAVAPEHAVALTKIEDELRRVLLGLRITTGMVHGDVTVNNLLLDPGSLKIVAVVDWEFSLANDLPFDFLHYLIAERRAATGRPWGELVAATLHAEVLDESARELLVKHIARFGVDERTLAAFLVAYWIRGVALRTELGRYSLAPGWKAANLSAPLERILRYLAPRRPG